MIGSPRAGGLAVRGEILDGTSAGGRASSAGWHTTESRWELIPKCRGEYPGAAPRAERFDGRGEGTASEEEPTAVLIGEQDEATLREARFSDVGLFYAGFTFRGWVAYA